MRLFTYLGEPLIKYDKRWKGIYAQDTHLSKAYANKSFSRDLSP